MRRQLYIWVLHNRDEWGSIDFTRGIGMLEKHIEKTFSKKKKCIHIFLSWDTFGFFFYTLVLKLKMSYRGRSSCRLQYTVFLYIYLSVVSVKAHVCACLSPCLWALSVGVWMCVLCDWHCVYKVVSLHISGQLSISHYFWALIVRCFYTF